MLREGGHGVGYGVRFVGHPEHADIVDLVAEYDYLQFMSDVRRQSMDREMAA